MLAAMQAAMQAGLLFLCFRRTEENLLDPPISFGHP
jgi:hypothetical protein